MSNGWDSLPRRDSDDQIPERRVPVERGPTRSRRLWSSTATGIVDRAASPAPSSNAAPSRSVKTRWRRSGRERATSPLRLRVAVTMRSKSSRSREESARDRKASRAGLSARPSRRRLFDASSQRADPGRAYIPALMTVASGITELSANCAVGERHTLPSHTMSTAISPRTPVIREGYRRSRSRKLVDVRCPPDGMNG